MHVQVRACVEWNAKEKLSSEERRKVHCSRGEMGHFYNF